jgi:hypothetical protein
MSGNSPLTLTQAIAETKRLKETVNSLREANLFLERERMDPSDDFSDYASDGTTSEAHVIQGLRNQIVSLQAIPDNDTWVRSLELDNANLKDENENLKNQLEQARALYVSIVTRTRDSNANSNSNAGTPTMQNNFAAGSHSMNTLNEHHHHHHHYAAPAHPTPVDTAQAAEGIRTLAIENVTMDQDDGTVMPRYKEHCEHELAGGCNNPRCVHLHQNQADKFPAEDIEALPLSRRAVRRAQGRRG